MKRISQISLLALSCLLVGYTEASADDIAVIQAQIDANNEQIQEIEAKYAQQEEEVTAEHESKKSSLKDQISKLMDAAGLVGDTLSNISIEGVQNKLSGMFGGDSGAVLNETLKNNFYDKNEEATAEGNARLDKFRQNTAFNDNAAVYAKAVDTMRVGDDNLEYTQKLASNAAVIETTPAGIMLDISLRVENMKILLQYAELLINEVKMNTANDLLGMSKKLRSYNKDVTEFNLDDYVYKPESSGGFSLNGLKDSVTGIAGSVSGAVNDAKNAANEAAGAAMGAVGSAVQGATGAVNNAVGSATGAINDAKGAVNNAVGSATGAVNDATGMVGDAKNAASSALGGAL